MVFPSRITPDLRGALCTSWAKGFHRAVPNLTSPERRAKLRLIKQKDATGCGIAAVAMVAGVSYEAAKDAVYPNRSARRRTFATDTVHLRDALRSLGIPVADRCIRVTKGTSQLPQTALLKTNRKPNGVFHWVVWDGKRKRILDPGVPPWERHVITSALFVGTPNQEEHEQ